MDVDGVLTDGRIIYDDRGVEYKAFDVHDGYGVFRGREHGLLFAIISGRVAKAVTKRAERMKVKEVHQGKRDKLAVLEMLCRKYTLSLPEICAIGDDLLDLPMLTVAGFSAAPPSAITAVRGAVDHITSAPGGRGAVREVIDMILEAKGLA